jgi:hypothetical protein
MQRSFWFIDLKIWRTFSTKVIRVVAFAPPPANVHFWRRSAFDDDLAII